MSESQKTPMDDGFDWEPALEWALEEIKQAFESGTYDEPAWVDTIADHLAYISDESEVVGELSVREGRMLVTELINRWEVEQISDDMWRDDKVMRK